MAGTSWGPFFAANDIKSKHVKLPCPGPLHGLWGGRKDEFSGLMSPPVRIPCLVPAAAAAARTLY